jgi:DNA-binding NtrC family response regulator
MAAARLLGISRRALYRRLDRHQIGDRPAPVHARRSPA